MLKLHASIRQLLLLLGTLATVSIWSSAVLQYRALRDQSREIARVHQYLTIADRYAEAARITGQERGLSNGLLSQPTGSSSAELSDVRHHLDLSLAQLLDSGLTAKDSSVAVPKDIRSRVDQLDRLRGQIDRREIAPAEAFGFYSDLVGAINDRAARQLAEGMLAIGLPYEHVNDLQHAAELLGQIRGLTSSVLAAGTLSPTTESELIERLALYKEALHNYDQSVPAADRAELIAAINAPAIHETIEHVQRLLLLHQATALDLDPTAWWSLATKAVDTLQYASQRELASLLSQSDLRMREIEHRLYLTVVTLVMLGVITMALVFIIVWHIMHRLTKLLRGLDTIRQGQDFSVRIEDSGRDEFAIISREINRLISIANTVVQEQESLSLTDPLTGIANRRGFDQQIMARTTPERAHIPPMSLVMIDIDHFKVINDNLGHVVGDQVLRSLGVLLQKTLRPDDVLARFGGEEFVALLPGCPLHEGLQVAETLRQAIATHDFNIGRSVTASLGVAEWSRNQTPEALIAAADACLYNAKTAGRNRVMPHFLSVKNH